MSRGWRIRNRGKFPSRKCEFSRAETSPAPAGSDLNTHEASAEKRTEMCAANGTATDTPPLRHPTNEPHDQDARGDNRGLGSLAAKAPPASTHVWPASLPTAGSPSSAFEASPRAT